MANRFAAEAAVDETRRQAIESTRRRLQVLALALDLGIELWESIASTMPWATVLQVGDSIVVGRSNAKSGVVVRVRERTYEVGFLSLGGKLETIGSGGTDGELVFVEAGLVRLLKLAADRLRDANAGGAA